MLVTCPNCTTRFKVPDSALLPSGRMLRCSRCLNQWHQELVAEEEAPRAAPQPAKPRPTLADAMQERQPARPMTVTEERVPRAKASAPAAMEAVAETEAEDEKGLAEEDEGAMAPAKVEDNPFDRIAELMMETPPAPIPDMFASHAEPAEERHRGVGWVLLVVLAVVVFLAAAAGALFALQEQVIARWPWTAHYYARLHVRDEIVGAGLTFRDYGADRKGEGNTEVLIVRGIIANTTDQARSIPLLRLALYDGQTMVQEKIIDPPQQKLDARATVAFRITLNQPDPHATRFDVTFAAPKMAAMKPGAAPAGERASTPGAPSQVQQEMPAEKPASPQQTPPAPQAPAAEPQAASPPSSKSP